MTKLKTKDDIGINGIPKFADYIKANEKASEFNKAVVTVKQLQKEKDLLKLQNDNLIGTLALETAKNDLTKLKSDIAQMLASTQPQLPNQPFEQPPAVYGGGGGPQMIPQDVMGEQQGMTMPMQGGGGTPNPMMA